MGTGDGCKIGMGDGYKIGTGDAMMKHGTGLQDSQVRDGRRRHVGHGRQPPSQWQQQGAGLSSGRSSAPLPQQPPFYSAAPAAAPKFDSGSHLRDLKSYFDEGLMTQEEYVHAKRRALGFARGTLFAPA